MGFQVDTSQFNAALKKIAGSAAPKLVARGLGKAGLQLMADAVTEAPTTPLDEGMLRGSASLFVQNGLQATGARQGYDDKAANRDHHEPIRAGNVVAVVGFNTPYAARWHESRPPHGFQEPSAGKKYLEKKLFENQDDYLAIVAREIREGAR